MRNVKPSCKTFSPIHLEGKACLVTELDRFSLPGVAEKEIFLLVTCFFSSTEKLL